jgi:hypothetical protein
MVVALLLLIIVVGYLAAKRPGALNGSTPPQTEKISLKYDVFLSSPMAAFESQEEYKKDRENILKIIGTLQEQCHFESVFYAGTKIQSINDFDVEDLSVSQDVKALRESRYFVLLYPKKIVSSVLVEAGFALAMGKTSIYFVKTRDDLPFLLRHAEQAVSFIKIYEDCDTEQIVKLITKHRSDLFVLANAANQ